MHAVVEGGSNIAECSEKDGSLSCVCRKQFSKTIEIINSRDVSVYILEFIISIVF